MRVPVFSCLSVLCPSVLAAAAGRLRPAADQEPCRSLARPAPGRRLTTLRRNQSGSAAVEFGFVVIPFVMLLFGITAQALNFWYEQVLETAVSDTTRLITTGQAQAASMTQAKFKTQMCNRLPSMFTCGNLQVDVRTYHSFATADTSRQTGAGTSAFVPAYEPGVGGNLVVVRAYYPMPIATNFLVNNTSTLPDGNRLLVSTQVFRNEPF